jgi:hypothetical protein
VTEQQPLVAFLEERLREDQGAAETAAPGPWHMDENQRIYAENGSYVTSPWTSDERDDDLDHVIRHDPARVLREVTAKRAILTEHPIRPADEPGDYSFGCERCYFNRDEGVYGSGYCRTLKALAAVYSDHPDYRKEWAA